jgi:TonB family protein
MFVSQFENEEQSFRNRKTSTAVVATILFHALILLILLFSILKEPNPPLEELSGGTTVNFGTDDAGTGDEQPFTYNPGPTTAAAAASTAQPAETAPEKVLTQENADNDVVAPKAEDKPKPKVNEKAVFKKTPKQTHTDNTTTATAPAPISAPQPKPDANAMFSKGAYGAPNKSHSDGTGGGQGDQGKPNGDLNSRNYLGDGDGNGEGSRPEPCKCSSQGTVVIAIKVDRNGKVTEASLLRFKSTAVEDCNINCALIAARQSTFNPDANAPEIQEGTITYIYKVH